MNLIFFILTDIGNILILMLDDCYGKERKTMVVVFAGPNGSGKSTVTNLVEKNGEYINADEIKSATKCSDLEAANIAQDLRERCLTEHKDFTFETVLSTPRNLDLLKRAKENDFFVRCYYVLTVSSTVNVARVRDRVRDGGHDVPVDKIRSRYDKALALIPELIPVCDIINIYDNTKEPFRIFSKKFGIYRLWENDFWSKDKIIALTKQEQFDMMYLK